jgi:hypothetical protein
MVPKVCWLSNECWANLGVLIFISKRQYMFFEPNLKLSPVCSIYFWKQSGHVNSCTLLLLVFQLVASLLIRIKDFVNGIIYFVSSSNLDFLDITQM